ncbi:hypothetical protein BCR34DRAFT_608871 [Clohesyomyces aquaticus]|uniref:Uncharacterized protein n=1 Tax=Clohesyomyces aquaticus TaxID=1231657 RepID=A0A1Y1Y2D3_9PLEO|nr:hypothetical protein BCR34DRAFT_608871 [Clohesyomyces aquaticus]
MSASRANRFVRDESRDAIVERLKGNELDVMRALLPRNQNQGQGRSQSHGQGEDEVPLVLRRTTIELEILHEHEHEYANKLLDFSFDMRMRLFPNLFLLLVYVKLCTYGGTPWSLALGTLYFLSWLALEGAVLLQYLVRLFLLFNRNHARYYYANPESDATSLKGLRIFNHVLVVTLITIVFESFTSRDIVAIFLVKYTERMLDSVREFHMHDFEQMKQFEPSA